uniref:ADAM metallopeptidase domain 28 n=1 Tax=Takifugu rubripes TaxID=31033 RepID=H2SJX2_TAKRU
MYFTCVSTESHSHEFGEVMHYQVVRPVRLHSLRKRGTESVRPETVKYAMTLGGRDIEMHLERNDELLTKDYTETYYQEDGSRVTVRPAYLCQDHCYYHGRIAGHSSSSVSISTCDGLRGYFRTSAQRYLIEPLSGGDEGNHAVMTLNAGNSTPRVCGVTNTSWSDDFEPPTGRSRSRSGVTAFPQQKYLELYLVGDFRMYEKLKRDRNAVRKRMFEIVNFVNMAYKPLRTFIALVGLEIWSNGDQISVTPPAGANLNAFMKWRNNELLKRKKHDNAHLISGIDFEGGTVGLAFIGTLCSGHSVGVVQDHNDRAIAIGATLAHEMGHNLGMDHDDSSACVCSGDSCIMAAALSWNIPRTFSSCSNNNYEKYLLNRSPSCLLNKPDYLSIEAPAVCGNGFKEKGEQCDCGTLQVNECTNPCCNATTCRLTEGSQCAEGDCCDNCKIAPRSKECRRKEDECDLEEYCDGQKAVCPEDVFAVNGLPCEEGRGYCYNGNCPQRPDQCVKMYGVGEYCYDKNTRGTYFAFCKRTAAQYIPCQAEDVMCGKLFCHNGQGNPNYGRMVQFGNCKASFFDDEDHTKDYGQVDAGTKCGDGMVCSQNECVELKTAYRNTNCSARCSGHAVCNHKNQCQCTPGWMPPDCTSEDGQFSLSKSKSRHWCVCVCVCVCVRYCWLLFNLSDMFQPAVVKPRIAPPPPPPAGNRPKPLMPNYMGARQVTCALFVSLSHTHTHVHVSAGADHLGLCCPGTEASPATKGLRFQPAPQLSMDPH